MSNDAHALAAEPVSEDDYQAFHAVLAATARGRAFLDEHARRHRHADTDMLLGALKRLENQVAAQVLPQAPPPAAPKSAFGEIAAVLETVRNARAEIDGVRLAGAVTQLVAALDAVQRKLAALIPTAPPPAVADPPPVKAPFALAITAVAAQALARAEEEPLRVFKAGEIPPPPPFTGDDFSSGEPEGEDPDLSGPASEETQPAEPKEEVASPASEPLLQSTAASDAPPQASAAAFDAVEDALAPVMALSEDERLALFT